MLFLKKNLVKIEIFNTITHQKCNKTWTGDCFLEIFEEIKAQNLNLTTLKQILASFEAYLNQILKKILLLFLSFLLLLSQQKKFHCCHVATWTCLVLKELTEWRINFKRHWFLAFDVIMQPSLETSFYCTIVLILEYCDLIKFITSLAQYGTHMYYVRSRDNQLHSTLHMCVFSKYDFEGYKLQSALKMKKKNVQ